MKTLLLKLEPLIWVLFGAGIMLGTMFMTAWVAVVGLGLPLGLLPADALDYDRAYALGASIIGRIMIVLLVALPLWKGAHHTRHVFIDMGGSARDSWVAPLLYLVALAGSVLAIVAAVRL